MRKCIFIFLGFWEFCLYISLYELFFIYTDSFIISISEQHHRLLVTCSHHLNPRFWSGGFLLNDSTEPSIYKLSSRAPRFFLPGHGRIFLLIVRIWTVYTASILLASSRILIAAFRSLSISFPHVQRYTLSDNPSSFFIFPHLLHFLLEGKKRSIFINSFPFQASL